ncbi:MAG: transposase [Methylococcales bacterium]|nr:MAG: transposase [Methylococcales bacterium]
MPRDDLLKGRVSIPGNVYHITSCTDGRRPFFEDFQNGRLLVMEMRQLHDEQSVNSLAWVIMPDHFHWLFQLNEPLSLSELVKKIKARSSIAINASMGRQGSVWQRGFHDHALRGDENLRSVARYIVGNPLRAGIVEHIGDYPLWDAIWL